MYGGVLLAGMIIELEFGEATCRSTPNLSDGESLPLALGEGLKGFAGGRLEILSRSRQTCEMLVTWKVWFNLNAPARS